MPRITSPDELAGLSERLRRQRKQVESWNVDVRGQPTVVLLADGRHLGAQGEIMPLAPVAFAAEAQNLDRDWLPYIEAVDAGTQLRYASRKLVSQHQRGHAAGQGVRLVHRRDARTVLPVLNIGAADASPRYFNLDFTLFGRGRFGPVIDQTDVIRFEPFQGFCCFGCVIMSKPTGNISAGCAEFGFSHNESPFPFAFEDVFEAFGGIAVSNSCRIVCNYPGAQCKAIPAIIGIGI